MCSIEYSQKSKLLLMQFDFLLKFPYKLISISRKEVIENIFESIHRNYNHIYVHERKEWNGFIDQVYRKLIDFKYSESESKDVEQKIAYNFLPKLFTYCKNINCRKIGKVKNDLCGIHINQRKEIIKKINEENKYLVNDVINIINDYLTYG
jgi:hypothetical protein